MTIPVTVIGGYLGAGKTTLVNHLLRHAGGVRLAVLVNELGALPIDADLIEGRDGDVLSIAGGCVCCSYGSDLMDAMITLRQREPGPEHVLIEASGVALPGSIAASVSLVEGYANDGIVVLADAETVRRLGRDRFLADTIARQLGDADLVLLNKADLVSAEALDATRAWIAGQSPRARIVVTSQSQAPPGVLLGSGLGRPVIPGLARGQHNAALYTTRTMDAAGPLDLATLAERLADPGLGILRAKGHLSGADGRLHAFQMVGTRATVTPAAGAPEHPGRLVVIGIAGAIDLDAIASVVNACGRGVRHLA